LQGLILLKKFVIISDIVKIKFMKADIHPKYYPKASVRCACGNNFTVGSAKEFIETEVCAKCHPFYTKQEKVMDTLGRVQKFKERLAKKSTTTKKK
jgi:large subunit ribosomal protein L31